jgi:hypothetical protein
LKPKYGKLLSRFAFKFNMRRYTKGMLPSTGFVTIYSVLQTCSHVTVYGFGRQSPVGGRADPPYRYYEKSKPAPPPRETAMTAMDVEVAALRAMQREARLVLCMVGRCRLTL